MMANRRLNDPEPINLDRCYAESARQMGIVSRRRQALDAAQGEDGEPRWYALCVAQHADKAVDNAMGDAGVARWMPARMLAPKRRGGRPHQSLEPRLEPVLPGYLFVRVVWTAYLWDWLSGVRGVVSPLGGASSPFPVRDANIVKMKAFIENDPEAVDVLTKALKKGQAVRVDSGPFASFTGVVLEVHRNARALVEVMIFGRSVNVDLDLAQLSKCE